MAAQNSKPIAITPKAISEFRYDQCIFEARHPFAVLHWDRAGAIWNEFSKKWPALEPNQAEPAQTQFLLDNRYTIFTSVEKSGVIDLQPSKTGTNSYLEIVQDFFQIIIKYLEISSFSRLGHRQVRFKKYADRENANASFLAMNLINIPPPSNFGIDTEPVLPECTLRWEDRKFGAVLRMKVEGKVQVLDAPGAPGLTRQVYEETGVVLDVDYYTMAPVPVGLLDTHAWLNQADKMISRGVNKILGER